MDNGTQTKRHRGTGLYRTHSRRRGDKESHIRELIMLAERDYTASEGAELTHDEVRAKIDNAIMNYQMALSLLKTLHLSTPTAQEEKDRLEQTLKQRITQLESEIKN